jgi:hypothetical protein
MVVGARHFADCAEHSDPSDYGIIHISRGLTDPIEGRWGVRRIIGPIAASFILACGPKRHRFLDC